MNNNLDKWLNFYRDDKKVMKELAKIEKNPDLFSDFFQAPFFNARGYSFYKGLGYNKLNHMSIMLLIQAFVDLIPNDLNLNILVAFNNDDSMLDYVTLAQQILASKGHKVYTFDKTQVLRTVINESFNNLQLDAAIYFNYQAENDKYKLTLIDGKGNSISNDIYEKINENMIKLDPLSDVKLVNRIPSIIRDYAIFDEYKNRVIKLAKRVNNPKKLILSVNENSTSFMTICSKVLGSLDFKYLLTKDKNILTKLSLRDSIYQAAINAFKDNADLLYATDSGGTHLSIGIRDGKDFKILTKLDFMILFTELFLFDLKKSNDLDEDKFVILPEYLGILLNQIFIKYQINWYAIEKFDESQSDYENHLFSVNRDNMFSFAPQYISYHDHLQLIVVFTELINFNKTQIGSITNIFNQTLNLYEPITSNYLNLKIDKKHVHELLNSFNENTINSEFESFDVSANDEYFLIQDIYKNLLIRIEYEEFSELLILEIYDLSGTKKIHLVKALFDEIKQFLKARKSK